MSKSRVYSASALLVIASLLWGWHASYAADTSVQPQNVSETDASQSEAPQIAVFGTNLRALWGERSYDAVFYKSRNAVPGNTWGDFRAFEEGTNAQYQWSDIAVTADGTTHIVYATGGTIYHRSKANNGGWSDRHGVATDNFPNPVRMAAAPNGTLWVVWRDGDGTAVRYRQSTNGGNNWSGGNVAQQSGNMSAPDVAVGPDNVPHVVWYIRSGSNNGGTARFADWNGSTWTIGNIFISGGYVADASIAVGKDNVQHAVYRRQSGDNWLIQHVSRAPGQNWGNQENVRTTNGDAGYAPAIAADDTGGVHFTWSELTGSGGRDVYYNVKLPTTGRFEPDRINVSERPGGWNSRSALVTTTDTTTGKVTAHVLYQRGERGQDVDEIYYRPIVSQSTIPCVVGQPSTASPSNLPFKVYLPLIGRC